MKFIFNFIMAPESPRPARALALALAAAFLACPRLAAAQEAPETPYFVAYSDDMEARGSLEVALQNTLGVPQHGLPVYTAPLVELEYGTRSWWTTGLYLEGQATTGDSAIFTGWRLENRFRPWGGEHRVNPVLYLEYENINEASRIQKEIVGHADLSPASNGELRRGIARELEGKLILSSDVRGWNLAENFIVEKNLTAEEGFEFGYALGLSHPVGKKLDAGLEMYGGLGSTRQFGLSQTAHYLAPGIAWKTEHAGTFRVSPALGLTSLSQTAFLRFGYSYDIDDFGGKVSRLFRGSKAAPSEGR